MEYLGHTYLENLIDSMTLVITLGNFMTKGDPKATYKTLPIQTTNSAWISILKNTDYKINQEHNITTVKNDKEH